MSTVQVMPTVNAWIFQKYSCTSKPLSKTRFKLWTCGLSSLKRCCLSNPLKVGVQRKCWNTSPSLGSPRGLYQEKIEWRPDSVYSSRLATLHKFTGREVSQRGMDPLLVKILPVRLAEHLSFLDGAKDMLIQKLLSETTV